MNHYKIKKALQLLMFVCASLFGIFLAKNTPVEERHGFSSLLKKEEVIQISEQKMKQVKSSPKQVDPLTSYLQEINVGIEQNNYEDRLHVPLILQTDPKWKTLPYGSGDSEGNTIEINGCAIVSLAMVASFLDQQAVKPSDVLEWSGNTYFLENEGTAWSIFGDFAAHKGYQAEELGNDLQAVKTHIEQGHPVIISVKPGHYTTTGHIMVVTGENEGQFWLNDPNDSPNKNHSNTLQVAEILTNEAFNFWAFY